MVFKKYYCAKCGTRLEKEKTHRTVTSEDYDYYRYQDYTRFPRRNFDVYHYRFKCPSCGVRTSFDEQCIIEKIQKKQGHLILSENAIKLDYEACKASNHKRVLLRNIWVSVFILFLFFALFFLFGTDRSAPNLVILFVMFLVFCTIAVISAIRQFKGNYKTKVKRSYSYEKEAQLEKLHTYSTHNKSAVIVSQKCYCFYCLSHIDPKEIETYIDDGKTALCPKCGIDSILPNSAAGTVDEDTLKEMQKYWF